MGFKVLSSVSTHNLWREVATNNGMRPWKSGRAEAESHLLFTLTCFSAAIIIAR